MSNILNAHFQGENNNPLRDTVNKRTCNFRYSCEVLISFEWCVQSLKWSQLQKLMILKLFWECNGICHYGFDQRAIACLMQHSFCVISKNFYPKFSIFKSPVWPPTPPPSPQFCINYCFQKLLGHVGGLHIPKSINLKTITYANSGRQTGSIMRDLKMVN